MAHVAALTIPTDVNKGTLYRAERAERYQGALPFIGALRQSPLWPGHGGGGSIEGVGMPHGRRDRVKRRNQPVLITDAAEDPEREIRRREIRYVAMMLTRALCLLAGAYIVVQKPPLWGLWASLCVAGMVLLPWLAVILANDRPPKRRAPVPPQTGGSDQPALPAAREHPVIDQD